MTELSQIISGYKKKMTDVAQASCIELSARVIDRTPVDTGLLEDSWTPAINKFDRTNKGGSIPAMAEKLKAGDSYTMINRQPYVRVIEYTGHSMKAPDGMMHISIAEWPSIVRGAMRGS